MVVLDVRCQMIAEPRMPGCEILTNGDGYDGLGMAVQYAARTAPVGTRAHSDGLSSVLSCRGRTWGWCAPRLTYRPCSFVTFLVCAARPGRR